MKKAAFIIGLFFIACTVKAQETVNVKITLENVLNDKGTIIAALHSSDTFMKGAGLINVEEKAKVGTIELTFENVVPGTYAVMVLHDENDNQRMDFQPNGMPIENYGMSGNDMSMGPPTFGDAQFEVSVQDVDLNIRF